MTSAIFQKALAATGFLLPDGTAAPGLVFSGGEDESRVRPVLSEGRAGLRVDAVFSA